MLKWCSYCQHFLGEKEPYDILDLSHGICSECRTQERHKDGSHIKNLKPILDFYNSLKQRALSAEGVNLREVIDESKQLGLSPLDTAIGILQPALIEMGKLYTQGKVTAAKEHAFTAFVDRMVTHLLAKSIDLDAEPSASPAVLLACVDGNYHWLGLKLLELALLEEKIPTRLFIPSLPTPEIIELALQLRPQIIGISIFDKAQAREGQQILDSIHSAVGISYQPLIAVGGNGARVYLDTQQVDSLHMGSVSFFRQAYDFTDFLKSQLKKAV